jgi:hypothetical protein
VKFIIPVFAIVACSAPELAPQTDLAGAQPVTSGLLIEDQSNTYPVSAWTAAVPLTLVAPGGSNIVVLEKLGVRVDVIQVREGRILVQCTGCEGEHAGAEGWMPRGVLWAALSTETAPDDAKDPLTLALQYRSWWTSGAPAPEGLTQAQACALVDGGWRMEPNLAVAESSGGKLVLSRTGASWSFVEAFVPTTALSGSCG